MKKIIPLSFIVSVFGFAAGFEQEIMWSGKGAGTANAVTSTVSGAEALYFNPAGLVVARDAAYKNDMSFNLSYIRSQFRAPTTTSDVETESKVGNSFSGSVLYARQFSDKLAFGAGVFPSAGLDISYPEETALNKSAKVDLRVYEFSAGAAYRPLPNWTFGAAYRISYSTAEFANFAGNGAVHVNFHGMKGWDFFSFRVGTQYKQDNWGIGLNIRTPVKVKVKGDVDASGPGGSSSSATIGTTFPLAVSLAGHYLVTDKLTLALDYTFLNYQAVDKLKIDTTATAGGAQIGDEDLSFKNGHAFRLGADYQLNVKTHLRAGYLFVTQITNKDTMIATSEPPGSGHIFTLGAGYAFNEAVEINGALFYGLASAKGNAVPGKSLGGTYSVNAFAVHTGVNWKF